MLKQQTQSLETYSKETETDDDRKSTYSSAANERASRSMLKSAKMNKTSRSISQSAEQKRISRSLQNLLIVDTKNEQKQLDESICLRSVFIGLEMQR